MKKYAYTLTGLVLAATAAHAQPAADAAGELEGPEAPAAEPATPADPAEPATSTDTGAESGADVAAEPADPADSATPASAATVAVTDTEVENFAKATVKLQEIQADTALAVDQKQTAMAAAVTEAGLDPAKYNEIGKAAAADTELRTRIQTAMARHAGNTDG